MSSTSSANLFIRDPREIVLDDLVDRDSAEMLADRILQFELIPTDSRISGRENNAIGAFRLLAE